MLEVQNRALIKTAEDRAKRIRELEGQLEQARLAADQKRELEQLQAQQLNTALDLKHAREEVERLTVLAEQLRPENARLAHHLAQAQGELVQMKGELDHSKRQREDERVQVHGELERAKRQVEEREAERDFYRNRAHELEQYNRELTEAATKYSAWGQKLERELAGIDPDGAPARRFGAGHDA